MSTQPSPQKPNLLLRHLHDVREYIARCFGVDDPVARYTRQVSQSEEDSTTDKRTSKNPR